MTRGTQRQCGGVTGLALAVLMAAPVGAQGEVDAAALRTVLALSDLATGSDQRAQANLPTRLTVRLTDVVSGQSPRGLSPRFMARPAGVGTPTCEQAARAYRATGSVPAGAVDFGTPLLVTETVDGAIGVADPKLNLQSANMLAAHRPETASRGIAPDPDRGRLIIAEPAAGRVTAVPVTGGAPVVLMDGLSNPRDPVVRDDLLYLVTDHSLLRLLLDGGPAEAIALGPGLVRLREDGGPLLGFATGGRIWQEEQVLDLPGPLADAVPAGPGAVLSVIAGTDSAMVTYLDAPGAPVEIPLGRAFSRLSADPQGRMAVAWSPGDPAFALIDLAIGQTVQAGALASGTLTEVRMSEDIAYLLSLDGGFVGVIALSSVRLGEALALSRVLLGPTAAAAPPSDPLSGEPVETRLLVPVGAFGQMMAVAPAVQTAFLIDPVMALNGQPPMDGTRLRGGIPLRVQSYDRDFKETASGEFQATWSFPAGDWELILTTGPGGFSACLPFVVEGPLADAAILPVRLAGQPDTVAVGRPSSLFLRFVDDQGQPVSVDSGDFLVPALGSGWRGTYPGQPQPDGTLRIDVDLPHTGPFAVQPLALPPGLRLRSALVIDAEEMP